MNQKGFVNIVLIVLVVVLVGVVGYFALVKKQGPIVQQTTTPPPSTTQTLTPQPPASTPKDGTADWKTYNTANYKIKYPADFSVYYWGRTDYLRSTPLNINDPYVKDAIYLAKNGLENKAVDLAPIQITVGVGSWGTLDQFEQREKAEAQPEIDRGTISPPTYRKIQLSNGQALEIQYDNQITIFVISGNRLYQISILKLKELTGQELEKLKTIVSTFELLK